VAAWNYSLALKNNGTVVAWGVNDLGQTSVPGGLSTVAAIAGNQTYCLALRSNGTVTAWGAAPTVPGGLTGVVGIAAGENHSLAVKSDGTVVAWGSNQSGESSIPAGLTGVTAVAGGWNHSVALAGSPVLPPFTVTNPRRTGSVFSLSVPSLNGNTYTLEYKNTLTSPTWTALSPIAGNGGMLTLSDSSATVPSRVYRVKRQ
jgi:hypothetical protein